MKVYVCEGWQDLRCGDYFEKCIVVVANSKNEALGMALETYTESKKGWWEIFPIKLEHGVRWHTDQ